MATKNDTPVVDEDKETLLEVRGIIDGVFDSGSTDYKTAVQAILDKVFIDGEYTLGGVLKHTTPDGITHYARACP